MDRVKFLAFGAVFSGLAYLFAKSLFRAGRTAEIHNRGLVLRRDETPVMFWVTFGLYSMATMFAVVAAALCILGVFII